MLANMQREKFSAVREYCDSNKIGWEMWESDTEVEIRVDLGQMGAKKRVEFRKHFGIKAKSIQIAVFWE